MPPEKVADVLALMGDCGRQRAGRAGHRREGGARADPGVRLARGAARAAPPRCRARPTARACRSTASRRCCRRSWPRSTPTCRWPSIRRRYGSIRRTPTRCASSSPSWSSSPWSRSWDRRRSRRRRAVAQAEEALSAEVWASAAASLGPRVVLAAVGEPPIGLAVVTGEASAAVFADFRRDGLRAAAVATLDGWLARRRPASSSGHDLKEVLRLSPRGPAARARLFDAMLVSYLLKPSLHGHGLDEVALERLGLQPITPRRRASSKGRCRCRATRGCSPTPPSARSCRRA